MGVIVAPRIDQLERHAVEIGPIAIEYAVGSVIKTSDDQRVFVAANHHEHVALLRHCAKACNPRKLLELPCKMRCERLWIARSKPALLNQRNVGIDGVSGFRNVAPQALINATGDFPQ